MSILNRFNQSNEEQRQARAKEEQQTKQDSTKAQLERIKQDNEKQREQASQGGSQAATEGERESVRAKLNKYSEEVKASRKEPLQSEQHQEQTQQTVHRPRRHR